MSLDVGNDRTTSGIAASIARQIRLGALTPGTRLPTVRALAAALDVSPTTVAEAWRRLGQAGMIETDGRRGTVVRTPPTLRPHRFTRLHPAAPHALDLSTGTPDPDLLPDVRPALRRLSRTAATASYFDPPVLPELEGLLREQWPFVPEQLTVVDGALDGLDRVFSVLLRLGDRVLVENPTFPPILDLLEAVGVQPIPIDTDGDGPRPDVVRAAVDEHNPAAVVLQPRAHNPTGARLTRTRARAIAAALSRSRAVVIEDDSAAGIATPSTTSIGAHLPARTVLVRSFSKSYGPDLRLAAVGGAGEVVEQLQGRRLLGPGWSSRLLQALLLDLLTDPAAESGVVRARAAYAERRGTLLAALTERGVRVTGADGLNVWLTVADESAALVTLALHGIAVAPGTPFCLGSLGEDHLRVTVSPLARDIDRVAAVLAEAALPARPRHIT